jgi:hypothetical protein
MDCTAAGPPWDIETNRSARQSQRGTGHHIDLMRSRAEYDRLRGPTGRYVDIAVDAMRENWGTDFPGGYLLAQFDIDIHITEGEKYVLVPAAIRKTKRKRLVPLSANAIGTAQLAFQGHQPPTKRR